MRLNYESYIMRSGKIKKIKDTSTRKSFNPAFKLCKLQLSGWLLLLLSHHES